MLLVSLIAPVLTGLTVLHFQRKALRKDVKHRILEGIPKSELTLVKISPENKNIRWKHSKEFEYNGEMYDVVRTEKHGDSTFYYCWWDNKETHLNQKLNETLLMELGKNASRNTTKNTLIDYFKSLFFIEELGNSPMYIAANGTNWVNYLEVDLPINLGNPAVPPPEMA